MRRRAVPYATGTSGQPLPYLPLPMARTGVPADEDRTALPIFQTGTRRQGVACGSRRRCTAARYSNGRECNFNGVTSEAEGGTSDRSDEQQRAGAGVAGVAGS